MRNVYLLMDPKPIGKTNVNLCIYTHTPTKNAQGTIGFGYCERFVELKKYNLRQLQDQARQASGGKKEGEAPGGVGDGAGAEEERGEEDGPA